MSSSIHAPLGFYELRIFTENPELKIFLSTKAQTHNEHYTRDPFVDSGFDLPTPDTETIQPGLSQKLNLAVKCALHNHTYNDEIPSAFYLYPRSSTGSKTPLRLANSVGIIDSGYRGNLMAVFDNHSTNPYEIKKHTHLVQICTPNLEPFMVTIADSLKELSRTTSRADGGFGSTGL